MAAFVLAACVGCSPQSDEPGSKKEDFAPRPKPAGFGPPKGAPAMPPAKGG